MTADVQHLFLFMIKSTVFAIHTLIERLPHILQTTEVYSVWLITDLDTTAHLKIRNIIYIF